MIGCRRVKQDLKQEGGFSRVALDVGRSPHARPPIGKLGADRANRCRHLAVRLLLWFIVLLLGSHSLLAQNATYTVKLLTPDAALKVAVATLEACRKQGYQVAVAVADRGGVTQVLLRDRFAGPHTVETAMNKAWTAVTFRQDTLAFDIATAREARAAGARILPRDLTSIARERTTGQ